MKTLYILNNNFHLTKKTSIKIAPISTVNELLSSVFKLTPNLSLFNEETNMSNFLRKQINSNMFPLKVNVLGTLPRQILQLHFTIFNLDLGISNRITVYHEIAPYEKIYPYLTRSFF